MTRFTSITRALFAVTTVVSVVVCARADLATPGESVPMIRPAGTAVASMAGWVAWHGGTDRVATNLLDEAIPWSKPIVAVTPTEAAYGGGTATDEVLILPPGPGSASLVLWAFGGIGLWQLGRSTRKVHLGALPEWYHAGGPDQVGHATPLDLEFSLSALPLCRFDAPVGAGGERPVSWRARCEPRVQTHSHIALTTAGPRAPPITD